MASSSDQPSTTNDNNEDDKTTPSSLESPSDDVRNRWASEQDVLRQRLREIDDVDAVLSTQLDSRERPEGEVPLKLIGGVDISFVKDNEFDACASLVVLRFPELDVVYERFAMVKLTEPYITGFLAFREVPHLQILVEELRLERPDLFPQVIVVDGNGVLHPRRFGLASHLGVICDVPTIGCGKSWLVVDGVDVAKYDAIEAGLQRGEHAEIVGESGQTWGAVVRVGDSKRAITVSVGHRVSLATAVNVALVTSKFSLPEPVRQADLRSREYLRKRSTQQ